MSFIRNLPFSLLAAALLSVPSTASAQRRMDPVGARGDAGTEIMCPAGMYMMGIVAKTGGWIDQVAIECGRVDSNSRVGSNWRSSPVGGNGGALKSERCIDGMVVNAIQIVLTDDSRMVYKLGMTCLAIWDGVTEQISIGGQYTPTDDGGLVDDRPAGPLPVQQACLRDFAATGLTLRYGKHVNAAGLICNKLVIPTASEVAAAPPAPPKRVISSKGRAPSTSADPNAPKPVGQFDLPFESESSLGGKFDIKLEVYSATGSSPIQFKVRGTLTNTDIGPEYNGTFDGLMAMGDTRTVRLTYTQPAANAKGTVVFRFSEDGETFTGDGMHQGHTPFKWTGRRKR